MSFHFWTDDEYAQSTQQQREYYRRTLMTEQQKNDDRFSLENAGYAGWKSAVEELELGQKGLRWLQGEAFKGLSVAGAVDAHWQNQDARDFRYHSLPLYQGYGTYVHNVLEEFKKNPSVPLATAKAALLTAEEASKGFPWAKANPDKIESYTMATLDPMLVSSWLTDGIKAAGAAREIDALMPHANNLMAAAGSKTISRAAMVAGKADALDAAQEAVRAAHATFKQDLASGFDPVRIGIEKAENAAAKAGDALRAAMAVGDNVPAANVGRDMVLAAKPLWGADAGSPMFVEAVRDMAHNGASPEDVARWMYHQGFRTSDWAAMNKMPLSQYFKRGWNLYSPRLKDAAMEKTWLQAAIQKEQLDALEHVPNMSSKELEQIQWAMKNIPRSPFDPVGSFESNWIKAAQEGKVNPLDVAPETYQKMKKVAADLSAGWRDNSEWRAAYSPSAGKSDYLIGEATDGASARTWQEHQNAYKPFDDVDEYRRAIAKVKTRVYKADNVDAFSKNVGNRIANINAALEKLGRDVNAPHELWADATPDVRKLYNERMVLKDMVKDLKLMRDSTDPMRALAEKDPTGTAEFIRKNYLKGMRAIKIAQLRWMPFWAYHRAFDMSARSALETGSPALREILSAVKSNRYVPAKDYLGRALDFAESPIEGLYAGEATGRGLRSGFEPKIAAIDGAAKNYIGKVIYDENLGKGLRAGLEEGTAHKYAMKAARERLDIVHGMYENKSAVQRALDYTHPYAGHYVQRMAYHMTLAAEHPSEAYALTRLREAQEDLSLDRKGALRLGDTSWGFDLPRRLTTVQAMEPFLHTDEILNAPQSFMQKVNRGLQAIAGEPFPQMRLMEQAAGIQGDSSSRPITDLESAAAFVARTVTGSDVLPSDPLFQLMGKNPGESRQDYTSRLAAVQMAANPKLAPDQAWQQAEDTHTINHLGSYVGIVKQTPAESQIYDALRDLRETTLRAAPEQRAQMRDQVIQEWKDKGVNIEPVAPLDPRARWQAVRNKLGDEDAKVDALKSTPDRSQTFTVPGSLPDEAKVRAGRLNDVIDSLRSSPAGALFQKVYDAVVPPASANDFDEDAFKKRVATIQGHDATMAAPEPSPVTLAKVTTLPGGRLYAPSNGSMADRQLNLEATDYLNAHLTALRALPNVDAQAAYIKSFADSTQNNALESAISRLANDPKNPNANAQHYMSALAYVAGGHQGQITGSLDPTVQRNVDEFSRSFSRYVATGDPAAVALVHGRPEAVIAAFNAGKIPAPGIAKGSIDFYAASIAQNGISENGLSMVLAKRQAEIARNYPGDHYWTEQLTHAVNNDPERAHDIVKDILLARDNPNTPAEYKASPQFFDTLQQKDGVLYDRAAMAQSLPEIQRTMWRVGKYDPQSNRLTAIDPVAVGKAMKQGDTPALVAISQGIAGPAAAKMLNDIIDQAPQPGSMAADTLSVAGLGNPHDIKGDPTQVGEWFKHPFQVLTGQTRHPLVDALNLPGDADTNEAVALAEKHPLSGAGAPGVKAAFNGAVTDALSDMGRDPQGNRQGEDLHDAPAGAAGAAPETRTNAGVSAPAAVAAATPLANQSPARAPAADVSFDFGGGASLALDLKAAAARPMISDSNPSGPVAFQRYGPAGGTVGFIRDVVDTKTRMDASFSADPSFFGGRAPTWGDAYDANATYNAPAPGGGVGPAQPALNGAQQLQAIDTLAKIGGNLAGATPGSDFSRGVSGLGAALGGYGAMSMLMGPALMAGPVGWGVAAAAVGIGVATGLMGPKKQDNSAYLQAQREAAAARAAQIAEQDRQQSVRDLGTREGELAKSVGTAGLTAQQRAQIQPQLATYQRRPTYQSRIGLADSAERAIGSAIHPRW